MGLCLGLAELDFRGDAGFLPRKPKRLPWELLGCTALGAVLELLGCTALGMVQGVLGGWAGVAGALPAGREQASEPDDSAYCLCSPARVFCSAPALTRLVGSGCTHSSTTACSTAASLVYPAGMRQDNERVASASAQKLWMTEVPLFGVRFWALGCI